MAVTIFINMENLDCLDIKKTSDIHITSFFLIDDKIDAWYEYIERQNIWDNRIFWTCKMWVVWIVLNFLLNLVAEKIISERNQLRIQ